MLQSILYYGNEKYLTVIDPSYVKKQNKQNSSVDEDCGAIKGGAWEAMITPTNLVHIFAIVLNA